MPSEARLLTGLALALAIVYWATPVAIRVAGRFEFYDKPIGYKGHAAPTPYLGGAAVVTGFIVAVLLLTGDWQRTLPLVGGVALLWAVGTVDDRRTVTPLVRVTVEIGLAVMLWSLGLGWNLGIGDWADLAITAFWVVAVVNAFNLFDNMDGAASSMAVVVAGGLAVLGVAHGDAWLSVVAAALCGACIGFLPHNLASPARIFLGDGGSMPIGFAVAALTMVGVSGAAPEWQSLAMGLLFVGVPALDTCLVMVSRTRRGVSVLTGGRDHLTHRAHRRLTTARAVAVSLGAAQAVISALALVAIEGGSTTVVAAVVLYLVAVGVAIALLDTRLAPVGLAGGAPAPPAPAAGRHARATRLPAPLLILLPLAVTLGLSPFFSGFYDSQLWVPGGLALVVVATAGAIARPVRLTAPAVLALGGLAALGAWALSSSAWAESIEQAVVEGNRLLVYAALLGTLLILVRSDRTAVWLMAALGVTALGVATLTFGRMLGSDPSSLFIAGRLDSPLGYINGQASFYLLALWPCVALAEQRRWPLLSGLGLATATLFASLLLLSQSRGVAVATVISALVVLTLVPGRVRRAWALLVVGAAVALAAPALVDVYEAGLNGPVPDDIASAAARAALLSAVVAGVLWSIVSTGIEARPAWSARLRPLAAAVLVAGAIVALGVGVVARETITRTVDQQYTAFVRLGVEPQGSGVGSRSTSRLASGAGTRYDYWRIAWGGFKERPLAGVGAGNYDRDYFANRATVEDVRQPHSVELQALSELGLVGAAFLVLFLAGLAWGAWRLSRAASASPAARALAVGAAGAVVAWLVHTSVDWIHLLPGVTGIALASAAVLLTAGARSPREPTRTVASSRRLRSRLVPAVIVAAGLAVTGVSLSRQALAEHFRYSARDALAAQPAQALRDADRALRLDPEAMQSYYVKAAALARFNKAGPARSALLSAAKREPHDFVTWGLIGDLAVRTGDLAEARRAYGRALALNPRDVGLRAAVKDPAAGLNEVSAGG